LAVLCGLTSAGDERAGAGSKAEGAAEGIRTVSTSAKVDRTHLDELVDIGVIGADDVVSIEIPIENDSSAELKVTNATATCSCLRVKSLPGKLPPGGRGSIVLSFRARSRRGLTEATATFETKNEAFGTFRVIARGMIEGIWCHPNVLNLGTVQSDQAHDQPGKFFVLVAGHPAATVTGVTSESPDLLCTLAPAGTTPEQMDQRLTVLKTVQVQWLGGSNRPLGPFRSNIFVETDVAGYERIQVPVDVFIQGTVPVRPPTIAFGLVGKGKTVSRQAAVNLSIVGPELQEADLSIQTDHEFVKAQLELDAQGPKSDAVKLVVTTTCPDSYDENIVKGTIRCRSSDRELFAVPYLAVFPKAASGK